MNTITRTVVFVVLALVLLGAGYILTIRPPSLSQNNNENPMNELKIEDITLGAGKEAVAGDKITVHYVGTLENGVKFDSSRDRGTPFSFVLGAGQVIAGWDQGFAGMKVGGKRRLTIPPALAYGSGGVPGAIPPNATLIFEVELLKVEANI